MTGYNVTHATRVAAGICVRCGLCPASKDTRTCDECREYIRQLHADRRIKTALERQAVKDALDASVRKAQEKRATLLAREPVEKKSHLWPIVRGMMGVMKMPRTTDQEEAKSRWPAPLRLPELHTMLRKPV